MICGVSLIIALCGLWAGYRGYRAARITYALAKALARQGLTDDEVTLLAERYSLDARKDFYRGVEVEGYTRSAGQESGQ